MDNQTTRVVEIGAVNPGEIVSETVGSPGTSAEPGSNLTETSKGTSTNSEAKSIYELLEEDIRKHPEMWLWTHKRWSRTKEEWLRRQNELANEGKTAE